MPVGRNEPTYNMQHKERGHALILAYENFSSYGPPVSTCMQFSFLRACMNEQLTDALLLYTARIHLVNLFASLLLTLSGPRSVAFYFTE